MPKTIMQGFDAFINKLVPLQSEHETAVSHHSSVKSSMENNFECYQFFETGSFGNGTGVRHHSDTDYFAACPKGELSINATTALRQVKIALQHTFWQTDKIVVKSPAVRIPFGSYASERLEVTPCRFNGMIQTPVGNKPYYDISDPRDGGSWMQSSPSAHNAYVNQENKRLGGKLKPLIQLVKAWKFYNSAPISSFYLELRVARYCEELSDIKYDTAVRNIMKKLCDNNLASIQDPMGISGYVQACSSEARYDIALSRLETGFTRADKAYSNRHLTEQAFHWWHLFYNKKFPSYY